jgi:putative DNA primase/helicase
MTKRHTKRPTIISTEFLKKGILVGYDDGRKKLVGDPICVLALGKGLQDKLAYTVLQLRDRDQQWRKAVIRSSLLTAHTIDFKEQLTDLYHYRLPDRKYTSPVIDALAARNPKRRIDITAVPGWQGNSRYAHPRRNIKADGDDWDCLFADDPNVLMGEFICKGMLNEWKQEVARHCRLSSRLRLAVGVPFAATILRRLGVDTFGFHFVGTTSSGKTLCLRVAGSVPGFNSEAGVTTWDGTPTGLEQLRLGRRDNVVPLDETGVIAGDEKKTAEFVGLSTYRFSQNRQKHRAREYARKHTVNSELLNIVLSTGEDLLPIGRRMRGQDVRLIQILACVSDQDDIFDAENASIIGTTTGQREQFVNEREAATRKFQGVALMEFLSWLVHDKNADRDLKKAVDEFIAKAPIPHSESRKAFARIRRRIAAVYAGMALAIDYGILPFSKEETLRDLRKCMNDAINLLLANEAPNAPALGESADDLISQFREHVLAANFIRAGAYANRRKSLTAEQIKAADGFINFAKPERYRVMLQTRSMRAWFPDERTCNRLVSLLRNQRLILAGRQDDASSRQVKIKPHAKKIPVYWLALKALGLQRKDLQVS